MEAPFSKVLFPLSSRYDPEWVRKNSLGENVLYNLETLCDIIDFSSGMKVLDLGSGKAVSAIFLAREFDVNVWAVDHRSDPTNNYLRAMDMSVDHKVFPMKINAGLLPFPKGFFDVIIAVDSFMYYGTNSAYTSYISEFLKLGGQIGIVDVCCDNHETDSMEAMMKEKASIFHSLNWWIDLWESSNLLTIKNAEVVPENNFIINEYIRDYRNGNGNRMDALAEELTIESSRLSVFRMSAVKKDSHSNSLYII